MKKVDFKVLNLGQSLTKLRKQTFFVKIWSCIYEISNLKDWYISNKVAIKLYRQVDLVRKHGCCPLDLSPLMKEDAQLRLRGRALAGWFSPEIVYKNRVISRDIIIRIFMMVISLSIVCSWRACHRGRRLHPVDHLWGFPLFLGSSQVLIWYLMAVVVEEVRHDECWELGDVGFLVIIKFDLIVGIY